MICNIKRYTAELIWCVYGYRGHMGAQGNQGDTGAYTGVGSVTQTRLPDSTFRGSSERRPQTQVRMRMCTWRRCACEGGWSSAILPMDSCCLAVTPHFYRRIHPPARYVSCDKVTDLASVENIQVFVIFRCLLY